MATDTTAAFWRIIQPWLHVSHPPCFSSPPLSLWKHLKFRKKLRTTDFHTFSFTSLLCLAPLHHYFTCTYTYISILFYSILHTSWSAALSAQDSNMELFQEERMKWSVVDKWHACLNFEHLKMYVSWRRNIHRTDNKAHASLYFIMRAPVLVNLLEIYQS